MRSDPRYLAVISRHDGDNNLPRSSNLSFLFLLLSRWFLSSHLSQCVFRLSSLLHIVSLVLIPRNLSILRLCLTRKFADPISTKLHCVSCLHWLHLSIMFETARCRLLSLLSLDATDISPSHVHGYDVEVHFLQFPFTSRIWEKNLPFRPSRFVSTLE